MFRIPGQTQQQRFIPLIPVRNSAIHYPVQNVHDEIDPLEKKRRIQIQIMQPVEKVLFILSSVRMKFYLMALSKFLQNGAVWPLAWGEQRVCPLTSWF